MTVEIAPVEGHADVLNGKVKWFNASKGFGFVTVAGIETDFLLHQQILRNTGRETIAEDAMVEFKYADSATGFRITKIVSIEAPMDPNAQYMDGDPDNVSAQRFPARVKWFDTKNAYGFVNCYGNDEDVFVGSSVLKRSALQELKVGEALCIQISEVDGRKSVYRIHDWISS
jgi:CspA family cold shock protein